MVLTLLLNTLNPQTGAESGDFHLDHMRIFLYRVKPLKFPQAADIPKR